MSAAHRDSTPSGERRSTASEALGRHLLDDLTVQFAKYRQLGERALAQVDDAAFFATVDRENNSPALNVKHVAGNQRSRWTDFLTRDGEKPDRHRDEEFVLRPADSREALMAAWADGWSRLAAALAALTPDDLRRTVTIRGEPHTVLQALNRQYAHYAYHVGQMVLLARHHVGEAWEPLSIPRGMSDTYEVGKDGAPYLVGERGRGATPDSEPPPGGGPR